jgi:hypothetical protein
MDTTISRARIGGLQIAIILLTLATAAIHLWLGVIIQQMMPGSFPMFILNGIGYIVLVTALYLPQLRRYHAWIRWALIAYTAITVIAWVVMGERNLIAYVDKIVEIALIVLLFIEGRNR